MSFKREMMPAEVGEAHDVPATPGTKQRSNLSISGVNLSFESSLQVVDTVEGVD